MTLKLSKINILVVEDVAPMRHLLCSVLESMGAGFVMSAPNGEAAFDIFCSRVPDIVVTDWLMAPGDGLELTRKIRTSPQSPDNKVPIIMMSGYSAHHRVAQARDTGITEFLVKPFSANDLAHRLAYVINHPRDFIECENYTGPDRRRHDDQDYAGPFRRHQDTFKTEEKQKAYIRQQQDG